MFGLHKRPLAYQCIISQLCLTGPRNFGCVVTVFVLCHFLMIPSVGLNVVFSGHTYLLFLCHFFSVEWIGLWYVIVTFPGHTNLYVVKH